MRKERDGVLHGGLSGLVLRHKARFLGGRQGGSAVVLQVPKGRVEGLRQTSGGSLRMIGNGTFTLARYTGITAMMERLMTYLPHAFLAATTLLIWASIVTSTLI